jgi:hypothetical protein
MVYYAVKRGTNPGIYLTWQECKAQITDYENYCYRKFTQYLPAVKFILSEDPIDCNTIKIGGYTQLSSDYYVYHMTIMDRKHRILLSEVFTGVNSEIQTLTIGLSLAMHLCDLCNYSVTTIVLEDLDLVQALNRDVPLPTLKDRLSVVYTMKLLPTYHRIQQLDIKVVYEAPPG